MAASTKPFSIDAGADFFERMLFKDGSGVAINLTGWIFSGELRRKYDDTGSAVASFTFTNDAPTSGIVKISMAAALTKAIPVDKAHDWRLPATMYCAEWRATRGGVVITLRKCEVAVYPQVVHAG